MGLLLIFKFLVRLIIQKIYQREESLGLANIETKRKNPGRIELASKWRLY